MNIRNRQTALFQGYSVCDSGKFDSFKMIIKLLLMCILMIAECYCACTRRGVECIEYQILGRNLGYEERQYPATTWVSTTTEGPSLTEANKEMYRKLFSYVQGNNVKGIKMNATTPIRTRIVPCHGATCSTIFIMSFLIPLDVSENSPYPLDTALFLEKDPPTRYAVRMFEGRASESDWLEESHKLAELVRKDTTIDKSYYYTVWYDPPYQLFHRTNEVWMVKKEKQQQQPTSNAGNNDYISADTKDHKHNES